MTLPYPIPPFTNEHGRIDALGVVAILAFSIMGLALIVVIMLGLAFAVISV